MTRIIYPYLGTPASMIQLPGPNGTITRDPITGPTVIALANGGEATVSPLNPSPDRITLPYTSQPNTGFANTLRMLRDGIFGRQLVYVDPAPDFANVLGVDQSTMGLRPGSAHGWVATSTSVATTTSQTSPVAGSGVLAWTLPGISGAYLQPGSVANTADITKAPVYLPGEPITVSMYLKGSTPITAIFYVYGYDAAGAVTSGVAGTTLINTGWTRNVATVAAGSLAAGTVYVLPRLLATTTNQTVYVAAAQVEYGDAASTWQMGSRAPRVSISAVPGWSAEKWDGYAASVLVLSEAYV